MRTNLFHDTPLNQYRRAVRGGRRPKGSFKFYNTSPYGDTPSIIIVTRRADGASLGALQRQVGRFLAHAPGRSWSRPIGSYATREDAAIALEGVHALKAHRRTVKERDERMRRYRDRTSEAREARTVAGP